ncbi:MAG: glucose-6-phosphate dehydrogenase assembly protein OpcA [Sporichthyaceae bacterium]
MTTTLWDTDGAEIVAALSHERRAAGAIASGLALTLVVVVDEKHVAEAKSAATTAAAAHPCRLLVVVRRSVEAEDRLDAEVEVGGHLGANECVVMRMFGRLTLHAESVVLPLLGSDSPVVTWWRGPPPERIAHDALGVLADRRITDCTATEDPTAELKRRAKDYAPGDSDLAWTRTTPWRSLLASAFDDSPVRSTSAQVEAEAGNPSARLVAGWLNARLGIRSKVVDSPGPGITAIEVRFEDKGRLRIDRPDGHIATLSGTGRPDRQLPLKRRDLGDLISEELRRLDADQPYAEALESATKTTGLNERPAKRTHVWKDPEPKKASQKKARQKTSTTKKSATKSTTKKSATKSTARKPARAKASR